MALVVGAGCRLVGWLRKRRQDGDGRVGGRQRTLTTPASRAPHLERNEKENNVMLRPSARPDPSLIDDQFMPPISLDELTQ